MIPGTNGNLPLVDTGSVTTTDFLTQAATTAVTAYDQQIVKQNATPAILVFVGLLLLANL